MPGIFGKGGEAEKRLNEGIECFRANRVAEAEGHFRAAAALAPERPDAHNNLGVALLSLGRLEEAAESFRRATQLRPSSVESHIALGDIAMRTGAPRQAAGHYADALSWQPQGERVHFARAQALGLAGEWAEAERHLREAVRLKPDFADAYCNLGLVLDERGQPDEARAMLERAIALDPANEDYRGNLRVLSSRGVPMWHFSMMNDGARNAAYEAAIRAAVRPGSTVLDIGTGSGLLAMMAARAGALRVITCEMVAPIAGKARQIVARNGFSDRVTVIARKSTQLRIPEDLPAPAEVLVSEIVAADLIGEGLLEAYEDARRLLTQHAAIIPAKAWVRGQLVAAEGVEEFVSVGTVSGLDLSDFNEFRPIKVHPAEAAVEFRALTEPFDVFEFDLLNTTHFAAERRHILAAVTATGRCVGVLQWIRLELGGGAFYENSPREGRGIRRAGHWQQVLHLLPGPATLEAGDVATIVAQHNRQNLLFRLEPKGSGAA